jgi:catechol 2,3-dioxygenase-like lactoylglutathione lyase family enzyme
VRRRADHAHEARVAGVRPPELILYFRVDDIHSARAELADRGAPFDDEPHVIARMPDHELWMAFFRDPDRNLHGLMAEVR